MPAHDEPVDGHVQAEAQKEDRRHHGVREDDEAHHDHHAHEIAAPAATFHQVQQEEEGQGQQSGCQHARHVAFREHDAEVVRQQEEQDAADHGPEEPDPPREQEERKGTEQGTQDHEQVSGGPDAACQISNADQDVVRERGVVAEHLLAAVPGREHVRVVVAEVNLLPQVLGFDQVPPCIGRPGVDHLRVAREQEPPEQEHRRRHDDDGGYAVSRTRGHSFTPNTTRGSWGSPTRAPV